MNKRWFISYLCIMKDMVNVKTESLYSCVVTNVSPARWLLESQYAIGGERVILYAEEISNSLAVELVHGGVGIPSAFFLEE